MFDFQKLQVYQKAKSFNHSVKRLILRSDFDRTTKDQLRRAAFSIMLNIAEGSSRFSNRDRRNFLIISRGSAFECVSIFEYEMEEETLSKEDYEKYYAILDEISRMLYALIKKLE